MNKMIPDGYKRILSHLEINPTQPVWMRDKDHFGIWRKYSPTHPDSFKYYLDSLVLIQRTDMAATDDPNVSRDEANRALEIKVGDEVAWHGAIGVVQFFRSADVAGVAFPTLNIKATELCINIAYLVKIKQCLR